MSDAAQYAGELEVRGGRLRLPPRYADATQFVVRQRTVTQDFVSGAAIDFAIWHDEDSDRDVVNPDLEPDEVRLAIYDAEPELYRVTVVDEEVDADG